MKCKYNDSGWCYCTTGESNDDNGACNNPLECKEYDKCQCEGCKISRDPMSGYQPCHNIEFSGNPPKEV